MTEKKYQQAVDWLFTQMPNYQTDGIKAYKPGLENILKLCDFFGNPQQQLRCIHIGGTNGKGSTSNMLASVLQESGYKVGLYNSPHLIDFTERIKVNGKNCSQKFVFDFIQKLKHLPHDITPSFFEFTTVMAFEYFRQQKLDFAIIEVGLGGRLDSTNIIQPILSAITNIQLDHQNILGNTLAEIAHEKAGIIKKNTPIVSGEENETLQNILQQKANEKNSRLVDATLLKHDFQSDLKGNYQQKNIKVVLALLDELRVLDFPISKENTKKGLLHVFENTGFIGRWFQFSDRPLTICDTAHNQAGLEMVFEQLNQYLQKKHIVLGFVNDKKIDDVLRLLPKNEYYYFVKPSVNRAKDPEDYKNLLKKEKINFKIFDSVSLGYQYAKGQCKADEMIFIGGSNFVVGDFLEKNLEK